MRITDYLEVGGNTTMYVLTATQTKEVFQIISLVLSIIISVIIITGKIVSWVKKATADGKITKEEIDELKKEIGKDVQETKEDIDELVEIAEEINKEK